MRRKTTCACAVLFITVAVAFFSDATAGFEGAFAAALQPPPTCCGPGVTLNRQEEHDEAIPGMKPFRLETPDISGVKAERNLVCETEYHQDKAAKKPDPHTIAARKQNRFESWLKKLDGNRYTAPAVNGCTEVLDVSGKVLVWGAIENRQTYDEFRRFEVAGRATTVPARFWPWQKVRQVSYDFIISEDDRRITRRTRLSDGGARDTVYLRCDPP